MQKKGIDSAGVVREAMFQQLNLAVYSGIRDSTRDIGITRLDSLAARGSARDSTVGLFQKAMAHVAREIEPKRKANHANPQSLSVTAIFRQLAGSLCVCGFLKP